MNRIPRLFLIALALAAVAGCGNKGPLVLPTPPAESEPVTAPADEPADAEPPIDPATVPATPPPEETPATPPVEDGDGHG